MRLHMQRHQALMAPKFAAVAEILDDLVKVCGIEYPAPIAVASKVAAAILNVEWIAASLAGILKSREQAVMRQWQNAAAELDAHSVWALAQKIGPKAAA